MEPNDVFSLGWTLDGELSPGDQLVVLESLLQDSIPEVQYELIRLIEALPVSQLELTSQVTAA
ncbi:MAG: hypothetical protein AB8E87_06850 [Prochlorococcus sp.]|jgi:hypothetical protein|nr:hypothetical protein [Prochlorococcaceae cyanobacterium Fu_MAG_50]